MYKRQHADTRQRRHCRGKPAILWKWLRVHISQHRLHSECRPGTISILLHHPSVVGILWEGATPHVLWLFAADFVVGWLRTLALLSILALGLIETVASLGSTRCSVHLLLARVLFLTLRLLGLIVLLPALLLRILVATIILPISLLALLLLVLVPIASALCLSGSAVLALRSRCETSLGGHCLESL